MAAIGKLKIMQRNNNDYKTDYWKIASSLEKPVSRLLKVLSNRDTVSFHLPPIFSEYNTLIAYNFNTNAIRPE